MYSKDQDLYNCISITQPYQVNLITKTAQINLPSKIYIFKFILPDDKTTYYMAAETDTFLKMKNKINAAFGLSKGNYYMKNSALPLENKIINDYNFSVIDINDITYEPFL